MACSEGFINLEGKFLASVIDSKECDDDWEEDTDNQASIRKQMMARLDIIINKSVSPDKTKSVSFSKRIRVIPIPNEREWYMDYATARQGHWVSDAQRFKNRVGK